MSRPAQTQLIGVGRRPLVTTTSDGGRRRRAVGVEEQCDRCGRFPTTMTPQQRLDLAQGFHTQGRYAAVLRLVAPLTARAPRTRADLDAQRLRAHAAYHLGRLAEA